MIDLLTLHAYRLRSWVDYKPHRQERTKRQWAMIGVAGVCAASVAAVFAASIQ